MNENSLVYLDKSVASSVILKKSLPQKINFTFIYLLAPTFKDLYKRIAKREALRKKNEKYLSKKAILFRFKEEINDMKKSIKLPYIYLVNDSLIRIKKLLKDPIKKSKLKNRK